MRDERNDRYNKKKYNELKTKLDKAIKNGHIMTRSSSSIHYTPLLHILIKEEYIDLVQKALASVTDPEDKRKVIVEKYNDEGYLNSYGKNSLELKTSNEIKDLLNKTIYDLWLQKKIIINNETKKS